MVKPNFLVDKANIKHKPNFLVDKANIKHKPSIFTKKYYGSMLEDA